MALFFRRPEPPSPLLLAALGLCALSAGVTAYAGLQTVRELKRLRKATEKGQEGGAAWEGLRGPLAEFLKTGAEVLKVPIEAIQIPKQVFEDLAIVVKNAVMTEDMQRTLRDKQEKNQIRTDNEGVMRARAETAKMEAIAEAAEAKAVAAKTKLDAMEITDAARGKAVEVHADAQAEAVGARARARAAKAAEEQAAQIAESTTRAYAKPNCALTPAEQFLKEGAEQRRSATFSE